MTLTASCFTIKKDLEGLNGSTIGCDITLFMVLKCTEKVLKFASVVWAGNLACTFQAVRCSWSCCPGGREDALEFVRCLGDMEVTEGEDAWFECQLQPLSVGLAVSWYKDDDLIPADDDDFKQTFDGHTARLYISGTYLDDAGVYTCTARTSDGRPEASSTATLVVNGQLTTHVHLVLLGAAALPV